MLVLRASNLQYLADGFPKRPWLCSAIHMIGNTRTLIARRPCNNLWLRVSRKRSPFLTHSLRSVSSSFTLLGLVLSRDSTGYRTGQEILIVMFGPLLESWEWIKAHNPGSLFKKKHRLNFITIHCTSLLLYRPKPAMPDANGVGFVSQIFISCL